MVIAENPGLPDGYENIDGEIYKVTASKKKKIVNSTIKVIGRIKIKDRIKDTLKLCVVVEFLNQSLGRKDTKTYEWDKVNSGRIICDLPDFVIIEPGCAQKAKEIFRWIIQNEMMEFPIEEKIIHSFGWDDKKFYWQNDAMKIPKYDEYKIAAQGAILIKFNSDPLNAAILGCIHGPLVEFLHNAGITHNFTTDFYGESGIGKTELVKICVNGKTGVIFAIASDRKNLIQYVKNAKDITIVLDDFNTAESERTRRRNQQTVSELIQMSCDSATVLIDECGCKDGFFHIMVNREEAFKNTSTINRTYSVEMKERLPLEQYDCMKDFSGEKMLHFIYFLIHFIENDYDKMAMKVQAEYKMFLCDARQKYQSRIANTIAVQKVLKRIIISYYKYIGFDERSIQQMDSILEDSINRVGREMCGALEARQSDACSKKALPRLVDLICNLGNGYDLSKNEKKYWKEKDDITGEIKIGFCVNRGYLSFDMEAMLRLLNSDEYTGDEVSKHVLSKELRTYGLANVDSEGKLCSRMNTKHRMYHVQIDRLLNVCVENDEAIWCIVRGWFTPEE